MPTISVNERLYGKSVERTIRWAKRGLEAHQNKDRQGLFGIIQGGDFEDIRKYCANELTKLPFDGFSIGGLSVGEPKSIQNKVLSYTTPHLPPNKPRYLMGVGSPGAILDGVERGIDMFDCVLPTRIARHSCAMTSKGRMILKIKNLKMILGHLMKNVIVILVKIIQELI